MQKLTLPKNEIRIHKNEFPSSFSSFHWIEHFSNGKKLKFNKIKIKAYGSNTFRTKLSSKSTANGIDWINLGYFSCTPSNNGTKHIIASFIVKHCSANIVFSGCKFTSTSSNVNKSTEKIYFQSLKINFFSKFELDTVRKRNCCNDAFIKMSYDYHLCEKLPTDYVKCKKPAINYGTCKKQLTLNL